MITVESTRFGRFELEDELLITFAAPLVGFPHSRRFVLISRGESDMIAWLHSVDEPEVAFPVVDPWNFFPGYELETDGAAERALGAESLSDLLTLTLVTVSEDQRETRANLRWPIIINKAKRVAVQAQNLLPVEIDPHLFPEEVVNDPAFKNETVLVEA